MLTFKKYVVESFLTEAAAAAGANVHQEHPEDNAVKSKAGFSHAMSTLRSIHKSLKSGKQSADTHISTKLDGSPAIVFGHHPKTGRFFVASKGAFNKEPKINYSHADIEKNHGQSPGLAKKLRHALEHLPKVTPKKGIFQGDYMHDQGDLHHTDHEVHFKPNTIRYHLDKTSPEGKKAIESKMGIAVHTKYEGNPDHPETMHASPLHDHSQFKHHKDVHMISPEAKL